VKIARSHPGSWPIWAQLAASVLVSVVLMAILGAVFGFGPQMVKR
jgi:hypothetical protein